jgi:hypothetical protein
MRISEGRSVIAWKPYIRWPGHYPRLGPVRHRTLTENDGVRHRQAPGSGCQATPELYQARQECYPLAAYICAGAKDNTGPYHDCTVMKMCFWQAERL